MQNRKLVLCSSSPRRQQLLKELGIEFEILIKEVEELFPHHLKAEQVAFYLAEKKADAFRSDFEKEKIYITADTIVWFNDEVLGKPVHADDAVRMLKKLSGKKHQVFTAVCLSSMDKKNIFSVKSDVQFRKISDETIRSYVEHYRPLDKAGSYGAQECLPEGMNPCSAQENIFLESIHHPDLFERTLSKTKIRIPIIEHINGSYFNVMGLPVVELYEGLGSW